MNKLDEILELKEKGLKNYEVAKIMNLAPNTITYYLKKSNYKHKKIKCICENEWCNKEFEIVEYIYDKELHKKCKECRLYEKECVVCGKKHNYQGLTCSSKCAWKLKKETYIKSCGTEHNFSKNSKSRIKWEDKMLQKFGIINIFQKEEIKEKIKETYIEKYGVDHNMKSPELLAKRRILFENKGLIIPLNELSEYQIYKNNVMSFTLYNLRVFGDDYFYENFKNDIGVNENHIDHIYSIKMGYLNKIKPYVIGSIINLRIIDSYKNISKGSKCDISKKDLLKKFNKFEKNNSKLLEEMKNKKSKYYDIYKKMKSNDNQKDNKKNK